MNNKIDRAIFYSKLYKVINFGQTPDETDPDYIYIKHSLSPIPANSLDEFYAYLCDNGDKYGNPKTSNLARNKLKQAVNDFTDILKGRLWEKYGLSKLVELLYQKIYSISIVGDFNDIQDQINHWKKIDFSKITFKIEGEQTPFDQDELAYIQSRTISKILEDFISISVVEIKEIIAIHYKNIFAKRYFSQGAKQVKLNDGGKIVMKLIGNTAKKI